MRYLFPLIYDRKVNRELPNLKLMTNSSKPIHLAIHFFPDQNEISLFVQNRQFANNRVCKKAFRECYQHGENTAEV